MSNKRAWFCQVFKREISDDLCYDSSQCLSGLYKIESTKELLEIENIPEAREICKNCSHSDME